MLADLRRELALAFDELFAVSLQARRASLDAGAPLYLSCVLDAAIRQLISLATARS